VITVVDRDLTRSLTAPRLEFGREPCVT
jgi:hypothetical protein